MRSPQSLNAEREFRNRLTSLGAILLEPEWLGSSQSHHVRCVAGHDCYPRPGNLRFDKGICSICYHNQRSKNAELRFRNRLRELGATLLEPVWRGSSSPHRAICIAGHETKIYPCNVIKGIGICKTCAGLDSKIAEQKFRIQLIRFGATLLEPWHGVMKIHRVRCAAGHICNPRPDHVIEGIGICAKCASKIWDVFYVVTNTLGNVKFGITSGDSRPRMRDHIRNGFINIVILWEELPDGLALKIEQTCTAMLCNENIKPTHGREYFPPQALPHVKLVAGYYLAHEIRRINETP